MRAQRFPILLLMWAIVSCSLPNEQTLQPGRHAPTDSRSQTKKWQGLVVTDNPYMICADRLEKMNKGGFGACLQFASDDSVGGHWVRQMRTTLSKALLPDERHD